ncbi:CBS domain-containing protein [Aeromonas allosaccharophila]|uniref:CBS domain-containing protein n=1 Tax=Aeromonas allosaccharophila TaxID=656 RepID=UPI0013C76012|nr:CBS domain-containing protein [Aeromonas allosaccharophila]WDO03386.1 CBS domain-containing protein [Aeromonas allosaccharophila]
MIAANVMTIAPITVNENTPIFEVVDLLLNLKISGLPVLDSDGIMVGIVTEGDLLRRRELGTEIKHPHWKELFFSPGRLAKDYIQSHASYAGEIMTANPLTISPETPLDEVIGLMEENNIKRLPVVKANRLVGIVTRVDILKALQTIWTRDRDCESEKVKKTDDESVKKEIIERIHSQPWAPRSNIRITVQHGVVDIDGVIWDENIRAALITLIEEVTGNGDIYDHLVFIEPITGFCIAKHS